MPEIDLTWWDYPGHVRPGSVARKKATLTDDERAAWRDRHVLKAPEPGVRVMVNLGLVQFSLLEDADGMILVRQQLARVIPGETVRAIRTSMDLDELSEVVSVLREYETEASPDPEEVPVGDL